MKISIVIVSWNVRECLIDCIASILHHSAGMNAEIIVVDNAGTDGTVEAVAQRFPEVRLIANTVNAGFARANNQGAAIARGEYLFILNPDTLFLANTLGELIAFMDGNPDIGLCGPHVLNDDRTTQRSVRGLPTWPMAFARHTPLGMLGLFHKSLSAWRCRDFDFTRVADVEQLIGAAMLVRRSVYERVEGFDERFFMYYEEVDLCKRIKEAGFRVVYYPGAEIVHLGGKSSGQIPARKRLMMLNSLLRYLQKYTHGLRSGVLSAFFKAGVVVQYVCESVLFSVGYVFSFVMHNKHHMSRNAGRCKAATEFLISYSMKFLRGQD